MHVARERLLQVSLILSDMGVITLAFFVSYWIRGSLLADTFGPIYPLEHYWWIYFVVTISLPLFLAVLRAYQANGIIKKRDAHLTAGGRVLQGVLLEYAFLAAL